MKSGTLIKVGIALVVLIAAVLLGGYFWTKSYIRSEEFQKIVTHEVEKVLGGDVTVTGTSWEGWKLECEAVQVLAADKFSDLEVNRISIELDPRGLIDRVWRVSDVHVREMSLVVSPRKLESQPQRVAKAAPVEFGVKDVGKAWLPRKAEINKVRVENFGGIFDLGDLSGVWSKFYVVLSRENQDYLLNIRRGEVTLDSYPDQPWEVVKLKGRVKADAVFLNEVEFKSDGAVLELSGEYTPEVGMVANGKVRDFSVSRAVTEDWQKKLSGRLSASFSMRQSPTTLEVKGSGEVARATVTALPFLDSLADYTAINKFRIIAFNVCEFDYSVFNEVITIDNIHMESRDFLKVKGKVRKGSSHTVGELEVGISDAIMPRMPVGSKTVFSRAEGGYNWTTLKVRQTPDGEWEEDFSSKFFAAAVKESVEGVTETAVQAVEGVTEGVNEVLNGDAGGVIDATKGILEQGTKSLFDILK